MLDAGSVVRVLRLLCCGFSCELPWVCFKLSVVLCGCVGSLGGDRRSFFGCSLSLC